VHDRAQAGRSQKPVLASAIDRHYVVPYSVMLTSLRRSNPSAEVEAFLLHYDLTDDDREYLRRISQSVAIRITVTKIPPYPFLLFATRRRSSLLERETMSPIAYAKAFFDRYVSRDVSRIISIDADIVVNGDLSEMFALQPDCPLAAVANIPRNHHHQFNSGFMIVDLNAWRRIGVSEIAERFLLTYSPALHSHDQQMLNLIFGTNWQKLNLKWNYMEDYFRFRDRVRAYEQAEIDSARNEPVIIHYAVGGDKPWRLRSQHPSRDLYLNFREVVLPLMSNLQLLDPQEKRIE
jgi:lipopolysaccharide biosynthesis glycosyltransferase